MYLKRMTTHRVVRLLRVVLPVVIVGLFAVFGWNYRSRRGPVSLPPKPAQTFPKDLAVLNEGFSFSRTDRGRTLFTVNAKTTLGFQDKKQMLQNVEVIVYGDRDGDPERRIVSDTCTYDEAKEDFQFVGNVVIRLDETTTARTQELTYNHQNHLVTSKLKSFMEQPGKMTGESDTFEYALDTGLLTLDGAVRVELIDGVRLETGRAVFHRKENRADVSNGVYLQSANGWIRGAAGRAEVQAESFQPTQIVIDGNVTAESRTAGSADVWQLRAGWLQADMGPGGNAEHVWTRGNVRVEKLSRTGSQVLTANEVDAAVDAMGAVAGVAAHQNARMVMGADRVLSSNTIFSNPANGVATEGDSILQVGEATIIGREFTIQQGTITTFDTPYRATLKSGDRETSADRTNAQFDSRTNQLAALDQAGNFTFKEGTRRGRAESARVTESGAVITLDGNPVINDPERQLEARQIQLNQKTGAFTATDRVKTVSQAGSGPLIVKASRAEGDQGAIVYTGAVELWRNDSYIRAERLEGATKDRAFRAEGNVRSDVGDVRATSDKLNYDDANETAHYIGNVRMQKKDVKLAAADMIAKIANGQLSDITAQGAIVVNQGVRRGTGDRAVYDAKSGEVTLTGQPAEVSDPQQGVVRGGRLVLSGSGERVLVETEPGARVTSRIKVRQ